MKYTSCQAKIPSKLAHVNSNAELFAGLKLGASRWRVSRERRAAGWSGTFAVVGGKVVQKEARERDGKNCLAYQLEFAEELANDT